ncbi:MAG: FtsW/RodA/SpoVE family cell cycle protein [Oscillospiraceae bacterium]|nr:FtsW/RodA/SpoVE family cell cycle protein [Oscillospiraceae bacterium]
MIIRRFLKNVWDVFRRGDMVLLLLCLVASGVGCVFIASATAHSGSMRYLVIQIGAIILGIISYVAVSAIDLDFVSEHRGVLVAFNIFLLLLLIPFGTDFESGNKSWLAFPFLPFSIQPAELCKITFVLILASVMASYQQRISSFRSVFTMLFHLILLVGLNILISEDAGVSLIFVFIFAGMALAGGVNWGWIGTGLGLVAAGAPLVWTYFMKEHQKSRILVLFDPTIDPQGIDERYHMKRSLLSLTGGGLTGQGLFQGNRTQIGALPAQHTDYIFSAIGEEAGFVGCFFVLALLVAIIIRCVVVGSRSQNYLRRMVCFGAATALIFQICSNVGMCIGVTPVIGLTLPFISYGGSSIVSLFAMLGLVSGVHARPSPKKHELYIRPYR